MVKLDFEFSAVRRKTVISNYLGVEKNNNFVQSYITLHYWIRNRFIIPLHSIEIRFISVRFSKNIYFVHEIRIISSNCSLLKNNVLLSFVVSVIVILGHSLHSSPC